MENRSLTNFCEDVRDLYNYLQTRPPGTTVLGDWFENLKYLGNNNINKCIDHIRSNYDKIPKNFPKEIKSIHYANNVKANDANAFKTERCEDCNNTGMFKLAMFDRSGVYFEPIIFCSRCNNYLNTVNDPGNRISKQELEAAGYKFKPFNKVLKYPHLKVKGGSIHKYKRIVKNFSVKHDLNKELEI